MKVLIATIGSDGDVIPFFALAQRLIARGHEVTLTTVDRYAKRAAELDVPFVAVGRPWDSALADETFRRIFAEAQPIKQLGVVVDATVDEQRVALPQLMELVPAFDVVVYAPIFVAAVAAARACRVAHVSAHFAPIHRAWSYGPTGASFGRWGNALMWSIAAGVLRRATDARLNTLVEAAGLPPWRDVLLESSHSPVLDLVAVSPHVLPKDPRWADEVVVCGYWFVESSPPPDAALERFVASSSEPPVVIGFGSMTGIDAKVTTETILEAVKDSKRRVVLQSGWAGLGLAAASGDIPQHVHIAGFVPHDWLFERAACVVHHGGAGTTAAVIRAGVPQTIVWHLGDQPVWGQKVAALGLGAKTRSHRKLEASWLRGVIDEMLASDSMRTKARALGTKVRAEDGLGVAASEIERAVERGSRSAG